MLLLIVFLSVQQHNTWNMYYNTPALIFHWLVMVLYTAGFSLPWMWNPAWLAAFSALVPLIGSDLFSISLIDILKHSSPCTLVQERTDVKLALHNWPCIFILASNGCWEGEGRLLSQRHARLHMRGLGFTWMASNPDKYEGWIVWRGDSSSWLWHREWLSIPSLHYNGTTADGEAESGSVSPDVQSKRINQGHPSMLLIMQEINDPRNFSMTEDSCWGEMSRCSYELSISSLIWDLIHE